MADAIRSIGVTEATRYRWRQEFGGLKSDQVKRLKDLEAENNWWSAGYAQAGLIVSGDWWRKLTALGLHADLGHLAGKLRISPAVCGS